MNWKHAIHSLIVSLILSGCGAYRQSNMFQLDGATELSNYAESREYIIQENDYITVAVFSGKGESLVDPDNLLQTVGEGSQNQSNQETQFEYRVYNGNVDLPMLGPVSIVGATLAEVDSILEYEYNRFYDSTFVRTELTSRRFIVIGPAGGEVIPIPYEGINLVEGLAMSQQLQGDFVAGSIRLIRGDLKSPDVFLVDLSTVEGMKQSIVPLEAGDIIYVEPVTRVWLEGAREVTPFVSILLNIATVTFVILNSIGR